MKQVVVPALLFIVSAFLSLSVIHLAFASFIVGAAISVLAIVRTRRAASLENPKSGSGLLIRSGVVLMVAPILTVALVVAGMSGLFK
jgi:hypothetical protein